MSAPMKRVTRGRREVLSTPWQSMPRADRMAWVTARLRIVAISPAGYRVITSRFITVSQERILDEMRRNPRMITLLEGGC